MDIQPQWIALIGAAVGASAATVAPLLNGLTTHRRERRLKKREEKLKRFEEIYERLASLNAAILTTYHPSVIGLMGKRSMQREKPPEFSRLDMLIGFYAPEVEKPYREIRDRIWQLYGEYVEFASVAEQGKMDEHVTNIIQHNNAWMMATTRLDQLMVQIAEHARSYEL